MTLSTNTERHLYYSSELENYKLPENMPDVRGWTIKDKDGTVVGKVHELIIDPKHNKARYLDMITGEDDKPTGTDRHLLIPVGFAEIDKDNDEILVKDVEKKIIIGSPDFAGMPVTRDHEMAVIKVYKPGVKHTDKPGEQFYDDEYYNEGRFYEPRRKKYRQKTIGDF